MREFTEEEKALLVKSATELFKISKSLYNIDIDISYKILDISDRLLDKFESINKMMQEPLFPKKSNSDCGCSKEQKNNISKFNCNSHTDSGRSKQSDVSKHVINDDKEIVDLVTKIRAKVEN